MENLLSFDRKSNPSAVHCCSLSAKSNGFALSVSNTSTNCSTRAARSNSSCTLFQHLLRRLYGRSAEKLDPKQMQLFEMLLNQLAPPTPAPQTTPQSAPAPEPGSNNGHGRRRLPDIRYTKVGRRNYYLLSFLDVYSRYVVHHELLAMMDDLSGSIEAAAARACST